MNTKSTLEILPRFGGFSSVHLIQEVVLGSTPEFGASDISIEYDINVMRARGPLQKVDVHTHV